MRPLLPLYAMVVSLGFLIGALINLDAKRPQVPFVAYAYLFTQLAAALTAAWGLHKPEQFKSVAYLLFYACMLLVTFATMVPLAWKLSGIHPDWLRIPIWLCALFGAGVSVLAINYYGGQGVLLLTQAFVLNACGLAASYSLIANLDRLTWLLTAGHSALWLCLGAGSLACALGRFRNPEKWQQLGVVLPSTIGFAIFGLMACSLLFGQKEAEHVWHTPNEREAQRELATAVSQRKAVQ